jgi:hypothetical protein
MATWALSLIPIMAMSVRILFASHDHRWSVGSRPYLLCHLATWASASVMGILVSSSDCSTVESKRFLDATIIITACHDSESVAVDAPAP